MKLISRKAIFTVVAALASLTTARAQNGYSTSFEDSDDFTAGYSLVDQPYDFGTSTEGPNAWKTNDLDGDTNTASGGPNAVGYSTNPSGFNYGTPTDQWAALGGIFGIAPRLLPGNNTDLVYPTDVSLANASDVAFHVQFAISSTGVNQDDSFGWTFRAGVDQLAQILFSPSGGSNLSVNLYDDPAGSNASQGLLNSSALLDYDTIYDLDVSFAADGTLTAITIRDLTTGNSTDYSPSGSYTLGVAANTLTDVAASWVIADGARGGDNYLTNAGTNALFFNNYSMVPEPTSALFALGLLAVTAGRRSRSKKS